MKDILKVYLELSSCNMENCPYGTDVECSDCNKKMVAEHDKQIRADAIDTSIAILKGLYTQIAEIFENIIRNAQHYNS